MTATVEAIYEDGAVRLLEKPEGLKNGRVQVTIADEVEPAKPRYLKRGEFKDCAGHMSTEEDFKIAEWHGEHKFDDL